MKKKKRKKAKRVTATAPNIIPIRELLRPPAPQKEGKTETRT